jgi:alkyldihydroxyacetonephosphate synthase
MRRWNGWGDEAQTYLLPVSALVYLESVIGRGCSSPDADLEDILKSVPPSRLSPNPLVETGQETRLLHACGQSLPDWVALRSGRIPAFPDGVAYPSSEAEVRELMGFAYSTGIQLIPYGGGTSVVGHINPLPGETPTLTVDVLRLDHLLALDETSRLATFEAGVTGPALEAQLNRRGYTLGHFPQSFEQSTLGGWIATRSSGQQSFHYGRIEALFAGGLIETPLGSLDLPPHPASAAGPDLRQIILGSEGRLGILTRATLRIRPLPEIDRFYGVFFRDWPAGLQAVRAVAQAGIPVSMLRLSDAQETETTLVLSGKDRLVSLAKRGLSAFSFGPERCLLIYGITGSQATATSADRRRARFYTIMEGCSPGL